MIPKNVDRDTQKASPISLTYSTGETQGQKILKKNRK